MREIVICFARTASGARPSQLRLSFLLLEEASQLPELVGPHTIGFHIGRLRKIILTGDVEQLPPMGFTEFENEFPVPHNISLSRYASPCSKERYLESATSSVTSSTKGGSGQIPPAMADPRSGVRGTSSPRVPRGVRPQAHISFPYLTPESYHASAAHQSPTPNTRVSLGDSSMTCSSGLRLPQKQRSWYFRTIRSRGRLCRSFSTSGDTMTSALQAWTHRKAQSPQCCSFNNSTRRRAWLGTFDRSK